MKSDENMKLFSEEIKKEKIITCDKKLTEYILNNAAEDEYINKIKEADVISVFDREYLKNLDRQEYALQRLIDEEQIKKNKKFKEEIITLSGFFKRKQIRIVFLKGLALAEKIYEKPEVRRSSDIDILINMDDVEAVLSGLSELGYCVLGEKIEAKTILERYGKEMQNETIHFPAFQKRINDSNVSSDIKLDCHVSIYGKMNNKFGYVKQVLDRAKEIEFHGKKIYVLETHDNIIFLICHYMREVFRNTPFRYISGWKKEKCSFKINLIHDIARLISLENIDFEILYQRLKAIEKLKEFRVAFYILAEIYDGLLPDEFINKLHSAQYSENLDVMPCVLRQLDDSGVRTILNNGYDQFVNQIMMKIKLHGEKVKNGEKIYILAPKSENKEKTNYSCKFLENSFADATINIESYLLIIQVEIYRNYSGSLYLPEISLILGSAEINKKYNCYLPKLSIEVDRHGENYIITSKINKKIVNYKKAEIKEGRTLIYNIEIGLDELGIKKERRFIFDFYINERNEEGEGKFSLRSWMASYNIETYGMFYAN